MPDIDSLPDSAAAEPSAAGVLRWPAHRKHRPRWPEPGFAFVDADQVGAWPDSMGLAWIDLAWIGLWLVGLVGILVFSRWAAVPFHLIWISFALLYSFRARTAGATLWVLAAMVVTTFAAITVNVMRGVQPPEALTVPPLMAAMFWIVIRHGRQPFASRPDGLGGAEDQRLVALQRRFLQDASHQLRTPITIALGHSELLARDLVDQQAKRDIEVVVAELNRLRLLSERLLLIAASADPDLLRPEAIELAEFAADAVWRWRPAADRRWQVGQLDTATASADRERLELAVDALLENAVQHTRPGDTISLSVLRANGSLEARLVVEDGGTGIAPAELAHIFDRFATGTREAGRRGTGLGLALVRAVALGHGGDVTASSTLGQGSRFELTLPVQPATTRTEGLDMDPCRSSR